MITVLITGHRGLIGSELTELCLAKGWQVHGIDNNFRMHFFGEDGNTFKNAILNDQLYEYLRDIRSFPGMEEQFKGINFDMIFHCCAQPAHEYARVNPIEDFQVNCIATVDLMEITRHCWPDAVFVFCSSSKVYGPVNSIPVVEYTTRYWPDRRKTLVMPGLVVRDNHTMGISEDFPLNPGDGRGIYGTGKAAADLYVQEYGLTYGLKTVIFRGQCMTGAREAAAEMHGFLGYLARCIREGREYTVFGFRGKQVRDCIHSEDFCKALLLTACLLYTSDATDE